MFHEVPIPMGMGMPMPMMGMPYQLMGNPFDQQMEIEYSPITQLVSSIAHLVEMHQKSKERLGDHEDRNQGIFPQLQELQQLQQQAIQMRGSPGSGGTHFNLIPYTREGVGPPGTSSGASGASRLINSISSDQVPPVMWRIGDLIGGKSDAKSVVDKEKEKENVYDMRKIQGFPIVKSVEDNVLRDELVSENDSKDKENKSWTVLEIARKVLGVDEIPTSAEGNAISQLLEELRKEKRPN